jgi:hypothetical protein
MTAAFASGTHILTARGEVAVEALRQGDAVETVSGEFRPVSFLGRRRVNCARHPRPHDVWPVRVRTDAFADGVPLRDLLLSPDHAIYLHDMAIPVRSLLNGLTIAQEAADEVTFWHVELSERDVIFAEGLPCETYPDNDGRAAFENGGKVIQLYPDFAPFVSESDDLRRLVISSDRLTKIRRYLVDRSRRQGLSIQAGEPRGNILPG